MFALLIKSITDILRTPCGRLKSRGRIDPGDRYDELAPKTLLQKPPVKAGGDKPRKLNKEAFLWFRWMFLWNRLHYIKIDYTTSLPLTDALIQSDFVTQFYFYIWYLEAIGIKYLQPWVTSQVP